MNLNLNFLSIKSDFSEALTLIKQFIKVSTGNNLSVLRSAGSFVLYKFITKTSNLSQQVIGVKILNTLVAMMTEGESIVFLAEVGIKSSKEFKEQFGATKLSFEAKVLSIINFGIVIRAQDESARELALQWLIAEIESVKELATKQLTPNLS